MSELFIIRHCESEANTLGILAGQIDYPLSAKGLSDARELADQFASVACPDCILASPLKRAHQTAEAFALRFDLPVVTDARLMEQHLGRFSGSTYTTLEKEASYQHDRSKRWDWVPEGGGESYAMIAARVTSCFQSRPELASSGKTLIVCHAVTMRLIKTVLEHRAPTYPLEIARNGEVWRVMFDRVGRTHKIESMMLID